MSIQFVNFSAPPSYELYLLSCVTYKRFHRNAFSRTLTKMCLSVNAALDQLSSKLPGNADTLIERGDFYAGITFPDVIFFCNG